MLLQNFTFTKIFELNTAWPLSETKMKLGILFCLYLKSYVLSIITLYFKIYGLSDVLCRSHANDTEQYSVYFSNAFQVPTEDFALYRVWNSLKKIYYKDGKQAYRPHYGGAIFCNVKVLPQSDQYTSTLSRIL